MRPPIFTPHFIHPFANSPSGKWTVRCRLSAWSHRLPFGLRSFNPPPMHTHVPLGLIIDRRPPRFFYYFRCLLYQFTVHMSKIPPLLYIFRYVGFIELLSCILHSRANVKPVPQCYLPPQFFSSTSLLGSRESRRFDRHELPLALGLVNEEGVYGIIINSIRQIVPGGY